MPSEPNQCSKQLLNGRLVTTVTPGRPAFPAQWF
jgi:hypothetical protein